MIRSIASSSAVASRSVFSAFRRFLVIGETERWSRRWNRTLMLTPSVRTCSAKSNFRRPRRSFFTLNTLYQNETRLRFFTLRFSAAP